MSHKAFLVKKQVLGIFSSEMASNDSNKSTFFPDQRKTKFRQYSSCILNVVFLVQSLIVIQTVLKTFFWKITVLKLFAAIFL